MALIISIAFMLFSLAGLLLGGNILVDSALLISQRRKAQLLGGTLIAAGTSLPEFFAALAASLKKEGVLVYAGMVGSNTFNITGILGLSMLVIFILDKALGRKNEAISSQKDSPPILLVLFLGSAIIPTFFMFAISPLSIGRGEGLFILFTALVLWLFTRNVIVSHDNEKRRENRWEVEKAISFMQKLLLKLKPNLWFLSVLFGAGLLAFSANILISSIEELRLHIKTPYITHLLAVVVLAIGSSLPELVTAIFSLIRGKRELIVGNIVVSNIFNTLVILPFAALIHPVFVSPSLLRDSIIMIAVHIGAGYLLFFHRKTSIIASLLFILLFATHIFAIIIF